jgi:hypothetical protein
MTYESSVPVSSKTRRASEDVKRSEGIAEKLPRIMSKYMNTGILWPDCTRAGTYMLVRDLLVQAKCRSDASGEFRRLSIAIGCPNVGKS